MARKKSKQKRKEDIQFCPHGHDTFICGRASNGWCRICSNEYQRKFKAEHEELISELKHRSYERHAEEIKQKRATYVEEHREEINKQKREYYEANKERLIAQVIEYYEENKDKVLAAKKKARKEHPERERRISIKNQDNRALRVPQWADWDKIDEFYINCPLGMVGDHYIPLQGDEVSGLHVSWNLQYLTPHENLKKKNKANLKEISDWYGKILQQAGLK